MKKLLLLRKSLKSPGGLILQVLRTADPKEKIVLTHKAWQELRAGKLSTGISHPPAEPSRPLLPKVLPDPLCRITSYSTPNRYVCCKAPSGIWHSRTWQFLISRHEDQRHSTCKLQRKSYYCRTCSTCKDMSLTALEHAEGIFKGGA